MLCNAAEENKLQSGDTRCNVILLNMTDRGIIKCTGDRYSQPNFKASTGAPLNVMKHNMTQHSTAEQLKEDVLCQKSNEIR